MQKDNGKRYTIDESWSFVLNKYLVNEQVMKEGLWKDTKDLAKEKIKDYKQRIKNNKTNYEKEKEMGTGNNRLNPFAVTAMNAAGQIFNRLNGNDQWKNIRGGYFDKNTTENEHTKNKNAILQKAHECVQTIMTYSAIGWSLSNECLPTQFVLVRLENGKNVVQLRDVTNNNVTGGNLMNFNQQTTNLDKSEGYAQSNIIRNWLKSSNQHTDFNVFKFRDDKSGKTSMPEELRNYEWFYNEFRNMIYTTNIDFNTFKKYISSVSGRLDKIDIEINKECYSNGYTNIAAVKENPSIKRLLNQKMEILLDAFNNIIKMFENKKAFDLNVNTQKGVVNLTSYFFNFDALVKKLNGLKKITINRFQLKRDIPKENGNNNNSNNVTTTWNGTDINLNYKTK